MAFTNTQMAKETVGRNVFVIEPANVLEGLTERIKACHASSDDVDGFGKPSNQLKWGLDG